MKQKRFYVVVHRRRAGQIEDDDLQQEIVLNGVDEGERLTPVLARRALRISGFSTPAEVWSNDDYGYRIYARSARKVWKKESENGEF